MTLNLSPDVEAVARKKANQAGIDDVGVFVERLIENASPEQALLPSPSDPRIAQAIADGLACGFEGAMDDAFWQARREELEAYIARKHEPDA